MAIAPSSRLEIVPSVCPHDCTSTCALEVERIDERTIGHVRGSHRNTYTDGVICEKVGRYAERVHHPDRLLYPLRRVGPKGSRRFERIGWEAALDLVAEAFTRQAKTYGPETVWPYYYAGTMGLVQRDGINRLRHAMGYSRWYSTICVKLSDTGWAAGVGEKRGVDLREIDNHSDLVIIWGGNPVNTQVNVMQHAMRAKRRGAPLVVVDPYRTGTAEKADIHLAPPAGHRRRARLRDHARALRRGLRRLEVPPRLHRLPRRDGRPRPHAHARVGRRHHRPHRGRDRQLRAALRPDQAVLHPLPPRLHALAQRRRPDARRHLPARGDGRLAVRGRRRHLRPDGDLQARPLAHRGPGPGGQVHPRPRPVAPGPHPDRRPGGAPGRPAGDGHARAEHEPRHGVPGDASGPQGPGPRGSLPLRARAVPHRDGRLRRCGAARHHVPRARRFLHGERPHLFPGGEEGDRAARRVPREPLRDRRAGSPPRRAAPGILHDRVGNHGRDAPASPACGTPRPTGSAAARTAPCRSRPRTSWTASPPRTGASTSRATGSASAAAGRRCPSCPITSTWSIAPRPSIRSGSWPRPRAGSSTPRSRRRRPPSRASAGPPRCCIPTTARRSA